jgi:hypothetical protein
MAACTRDCEQLKDTLEMWLETFPDKITFGDDCFPYNQVLDAAFLHDTAVKLCEGRVY